MHDSFTPLLGQQRTCALCHPRALISLLPTVSRAHSINYFPSLLSSVSPLSSLSFSSLSPPSITTLSHEHSRLRLCHLLKNKGPPQSQVLLPALILFLLYRQIFSICIPLISLLIPLHWARNPIRVKIKYTNTISSLYSSNCQMDLMLKKCQLHL